MSGDGRTALKGCVWGPSDVTVRAVGTHTGRLAAGAAGATAGLLAWLPVPAVDVVCPPPGEGRTQCVLNEVWLSALLHVLLGAFLAALAVQGVRSAPGFLRVQRARRARQAAPVPPDPHLLAARWDRMDRWTRDAPPPLPVDASGRLSPDDLRDWLAATASEAAGPR